MCILSFTILKLFYNNLCFYVCCCWSLHSTWYTAQGTVQCYRCMWTILLSVSVVLLSGVRPIKVSMEPHWHACTVFSTYCTVPNTKHVACTYVCVYICCNICCINILFICCMYMLYIHLCTVLPCYSTTVLCWLRYN